MQIDGVVLIMGLWSLLITLFIGGLSWMTNRIFKLLDDLQREDALIKAEVSRTYVRREDYREFQKQILETMCRIEEKLDTKQDKHWREES